MEPKPDTVRFAADRVTIELLGDLQANHYGVGFHKPIPNSTDFETYFNYSTMTPFKSNKTSLNRGKISIDARLESTPTHITIELGSGLFRLFIEKDE